MGMAVKSSVSFLQRSAQQFNACHLLAYTGDLKLVKWTGNHKDCTFGHVWASGHVWLLTGMVTNTWVSSRPGVGGGVLDSTLGTHCEKDPKSSGCDKQRLKSSARPIPLNTGAVGHPYSP